MIGLSEGIARGVNTEPPKAAEEKEQWIADANVMISINGYI